MNNTVGVVVPVYGTEKYIAECVESVLGQTYANFRLILIDDATPDNAGVICDEFAKKDSRITVIHQENTGVTRARANGVAVANDCDFITFLDSDDTLTPDALDRFVSAMTPEVDIVISYRVANCPDCIPIEKGQITTRDFRESMLFERISCAPWGKLFRRTLFDENTFDISREIVVGEDMLMNIRLSYNSSKHVNVIHYDVYNYNIYDENTTKRFVRTPEFEGLWYRAILESIKDGEEKQAYIRFALPYRLQKYINFGGYELDNRFIAQSDFYKDLKDDVRIYKYPLSFRKRLLLNSTNIFLRFVFINIKKIRTEVKGFFKHPDNEVWRAVLHEVNNYRNPVDRAEEGYFLASSTRQQQKKKVVCIYDSHVKIGGWADRLRGILSVYHVCRKQNVDFKILFHHPFEIERYLIPNKVQWGITVDDLNRNLAETDLCFVSTRTNGRYEMRKQESWFRKEFKKKFCEYHVRTNAAFSYKYNFSQLFNELFKPSLLLENLIKKQKELLGDDYLSVSFRFLDLLGDFNETCSRGALPAESKRQLVDKCLRQIEILHKKHPGKRILVNSDSSYFLHEADKFDYTYIIPGEISHVDSHKHVAEDLHDKTITDFFMIANAKHIYLVVADQMYDSGFPYAASRLYNRPFSRISC